MIKLNVWLTVDPEEKYTYRLGACPDGQGRLQGQLIYTQLLHLPRGLGMEHSITTDMLAKRKILGNEIQGDFEFRLNEQNKIFSGTKNCSKTIERS